MTTPQLCHGSLTIERTYAAPPSRVFAAWANIETKAQWFVGPPERWTLVTRELDFRVGGTEVLEGLFDKDVIVRFTARYHAIIPNERLVYVYDLDGCDRNQSVSLVSVEFAPTASGGTRMTFTEQIVFCDGQDGVEARRSGTSDHFDRLALVVDAPVGATSDGPGTQRSR